MLSEALRDKSHWPKDFKWNYYSHTHCVMGLVNELWHIADHILTSYDMAVIFNMNHNDAEKLFLYQSAPWYRLQVSPKRVAKAIDKYLELKKMMEKFEHTQEKSIPIVYGLS